MSTKNLAADEITIKKIADDARNEASTTGTQATFAINYINFEKGLKSNEPDSRLREVILLYFNEKDPIARYPALVWLDGNGYSNKALAWIKQEAHLIISQDFGTRSKEFALLAESALDTDRSTLVKYYQTASKHGYREEIIRLLFENWDTIRSGCYTASIILTGETLFRINCELIRDLGITQGFMQLSENGKQISPNELTPNFFQNNYTLNKCIDFLYNSKKIDFRNFEANHLLRHLRNEVVHGNFPQLSYYDPGLHGPSELSDEDFELFFGNDNYIEPPQQYYIVFSYSQGEGTKKATTESRFYINQELLNLNLQNLHYRTKQKI